MTAIFAMWNHGGFSIAADSNATMPDSEGNSLWIDPVEKILALENVPIAFAASGTSRIDKIDINELVRSWESTLTGSFSTLEDYVVSFLTWFYSLEHNEVRFGSEEKFKDDFEANLRAWRDIFVENEFDYENSTFEEIVNFAVGTQNYHELKDLNIFGLRSKDFESQKLSPSENPSGFEKFRYELAAKIVDNVHEQIKGTPFNNIRKNKVYEKIHPYLEEIFQNVFFTNWDASKAWQLAMLEVEYVWLENMFRVRGSHAECLIIGYGTDDWFPKAIKFKLANSEYGFKKAQLTQVADPTYEWYLSLGYDEATDGLIRGYSSKLLQDLETDFKDHIKRGHIEELKNSFHSYGRKRLNKTLAKVDNLTVARLEYVARLFVELEALSSYLNEPLPGVGGNVQVLTMTKTTRSSQVYLEMP